MPFIVNLTSLSVVTGRVACTQMQFKKDLKNNKNLNTSGKVLLKCDNLFEPRRGWQSPFKPHFRPRIFFKNTL